MFNELRCKYNNFIFVCMCFVYLINNIYSIYVNNFYKNNL